MREPLAIFVAMALALTGVGAVFAGPGALPAASTTVAEVCEVTDWSTEQIIDKAKLTWDVVFRCADAPDEGSYEFTVVVASDAASEEAVVIEELTLTHLTPPVWGDGPSATGATDDLPITIEPGASGSFIVKGTYELTSTGAVKKLNIHFRVAGKGEDSSEPFFQGMTVLIRGSEVDEEEDEDGGPPPWAPGPPPWVGGERDDEDEENGDESGRQPGPPSWVPGPPPWVQTGDEEDEDENGADTGRKLGPPSWAPGPPPWVSPNEEEEEDENDGDTGVKAGPPSWVPGPPPWVGQNGGDDDEDDNGQATAVGKGEPKPARNGPPSFVPGPRQR